MGKYYTKEENIKYLKRFTSYNLSRYSDGQLASIRKKTEASIEKKIASIIAYQSSHLELINPYPIEKLRKKTIEELREIEVKYGINTFPEKKKKPKKSPARVEQIRIEDIKISSDNINSETTESIAEPKEEMAYLTEEEIRLMYPGEDYTVKELADRGIILNVDSQKFNSYEDDRRKRKLKLEIAKTIIEIQKQTRMQFFDLANKDITEISLEELKEMYQYVTAFVTGYPKFEEVGKSLGLRMSRD